MGQPRTSSSFSRFICFTNVVSVRLSIALQLRSTTRRMGVGSSGTGPPVSDGAKVTGKACCRRWHSAMMMARSSPLIGLHHEYTHAVGHATAAASRRTASVGERTAHTPSCQVDAVPQLRAQVVLHTHNTHTHTHTPRQRCNRRSTALPQPHARGTGSTAARS
jgi:hypothetical protein